MSSDPLKSANEVLRIARMSAKQKMPPEWREAKLSDSRERKRRSRERAEHRAKKIRTIFELLLSGFSQTEAGAAVGMSQPRVSETISKFWPFPSPGRDSRYMAVRISPEERKALDEIASSMLLTPSRALEEIVKENLQGGGVVAKRTLKVRS